MNDWRKTRISGMILGSTRYLHSNREKKVGSIGGCQRGRAGRRLLETGRRRGERGLGAPPCARGSTDTRTASFQTGSRCRSSAKPGVQYLSIYKPVETNTSIFTDTEATRGGADPPRGRG
jgi:hypothetical protein